MKQNVKKINLLPATYKQEQKLKIYKYIGISALLIECMIFVIGIVILPQIKLNKQQQTLEALKKKVNDSKYEEVGQVMQLLEEAQADLRLWTEKCNTLQEPNFISGRVLDSLTTGVPKGNVIQSLSLEVDDELMGESIHLTGIALNYNAVLSYVTMLESKYGSAQISFTADKQEKEKRSYYNYAITIENMAGDSVAQITSEEKIDETLEENETW